MSDAAALLKMQKEAFRPLYDRYQDEGSPYLEPLSKVEARLSAPHGGYYWICLDGVRVGAVWAGSRSPGRIHLGPLFVLPGWQNKGIGQAALLQLEEIMGPGVWELDTLLQEPGNCHLYEKLGYLPTGTKRIVNDRLTLIDYEKIVK